MDFEPGEIKEKGRLQPGKILMIDTEQGKIYYDGELSIGKISPSASRFI